MTRNSGLLLGGMAHLRVTIKKFERLKGLDDVDHVCTFGRAPLDRLRENGAELWKAGLNPTVNLHLSAEEWSEIAKNWQQNCSVTSSRYPGSLVEANVGDLSRLSFPRCSGTVVHELSSNIVNLLPLPTAFLLVSVLIVGIAIVHLQVGLKHKFS